MDGFGGAEDSASEDEQEDDLLALPNTGVDGARSSSTEGPGPNDPVGVNGSRHSHDEDDFAIEDDDFIEEASLMGAKTGTKHTGRKPHPNSEAALESKRTSSPLGMRESVGPGGGRRLSNGIGQSMNEYGAGASPYQ